MTKTTIRLSTPTLGLPSPTLETSTTNLQKCHDQHQPRLSPNILPSLLLRPLAHLPHLGPTQRRRRARPDHKTGLRRYSLLFPHSSRHPSLLPTPRRTTLQTQRSPFPSIPPLLNRKPHINAPLAALLRTGQNLYFHLNHPIKWIRLVGAIVARDSYERRLVLTLDDSSGTTIELTCLKTPDLTTTPPADTGDIHPRPHPGTLVTSTATGVSPSGNILSLEGVDVGTVVKAKGGISEFRGTKQLVLERITVVETTDAEVRAWEEGVRFRMEVLVGPWVVEEGVRRRLEVEAGEGGGKGRRRQRREKGEKGEGRVGGKEGRRGERRRKGDGEVEAKERRHRHGHGHRHRRMHKRH